MEDFTWREYAYLLNAAYLLVLVRWRPTAKFLPAEAAGTGPEFLQTSCRHICTFYEAPVLVRVCTLSARGLFECSECSLGIPISGQSGCAPL